MHAVKNLIIIVTKISKIMLQLLKK